MDPLGAVWEWYEYARDSIGHAAHRLEIDPDSIPGFLVFASPRRETALEKLARAHGELDDLTVLALFAVFEQALLDHLVLISQSVQQGAATALEESLASRALKDLQRWPLDDVLDVYKAALDANLVGLAKQVKDYRDWVAHGKKGPPDARIDPRMAYDRLSDILGALAR